MLGLRVDADELAAPVRRRHRALHRALQQGDQRRRGEDRSCRTEGTCARSWHACRTLPCAARAHAHEAGTRRAYVQCGSSGTVWVSSGGWRVTARLTPPLRRRRLRPSVGGLRHASEVAAAREASRATPRSRAPHEAEPRGGMSDCHPGGIARRVLVAGLSVVFLKLKRFAGVCVCSTRVLHLQ